MKEKSIFDKIYRKELDLNFNNLKNIKTLDEKKETSSLDTKVDLKTASNESLDAFITLLYKNSLIFKSFDVFHVIPTFENQFFLVVFVQRRQTDS